jgi:hypothetical protein
LCDAGEIREYVVVGAAVAGVVVVEAGEAGVGAGEAVSGVVIVSVEA